MNFTFFVVRKPVAKISFLFSCRLENVGSFRAYMILRKNLLLSGGGVTLL